MKRFGPSRAVLTAALLTLVFPSAVLASVALASMVLAPAAARAGELTASSASVRNCTWCHGTPAQGYTVAPRLAGQQPRYLENQLIGFAAHRRDNPFAKQYMWNAVAALRPQAIHDLAVYFAALSPRPASDGHRDVASRGETIYREGIPDGNVAACLACHGPNAEGVREIPRLGGLSYLYLKERLQQWGEGYHGAIASPMPVVARSLSADEIEALASYLSFVR